MHLPSQVIGIYFIATSKHIAGWLRKARVDGVLVFTTPPNRKLKLERIFVTQPRSDNSAKRQSSCGYLQVGYLFWAKGRSRYRCFRCAGIFGMIHFVAMS